MKPIRRHAAAAILAIMASATVATGASASQLARRTITWDNPTATAEYGAYWSFSAIAVDAAAPSGPWHAAGTMSGAPSGYAPMFAAYQTDFNTVAVYVNPPSGSRPLPAGSYSTTFTITGETGGGPDSPPSPATLTITPASLAVTLQVVADPSNPANAIIASELTGAFRDNFFTSSYPEGPLSPAGTWHFSVTDDNGDVVHEFDQDRAETDDIMGASDYWSDVPPGSYSVSATFTASGASAGNFAITAPAPVTYGAAPAPGSTSTATPAPPAPPPATDQAGFTLPLWIPLAAGVLSAGLIAMLIVQIVRLRRTAVPAPTHKPHGGAA